MKKVEKILSKSKKKRLKEAYAEKRKKKARVKRST